MSHYLGNPSSTAGMVKLPSVLRGYDAPFDRSVTATALISGGTTTAAQLNARRTPTLAWRALTPTEFSTVWGFYSRAWGIGPYALLDTYWDNQLRPDVALCGSRRGVATGWAVSVGTVVYDSTVAPFALPSGAMRWAGAGNGSVLGEGSLVTTLIEANTGFATPYVSDQPYTVSLYAKSASGTPSVTLRVSARNAAQTLHTDTAGTPTALNSSTWTRLTTSVAAGSYATGQFVIPTLLCNTAAAPDILLSCPQLQLKSTVTAWTIGVGVPRCLPVGTAPNPVAVINMGRDLTLSLAEV